MVYEKWSHWDLLLYEEITEHRYLCSIHMFLPRRMFRSEFRSALSNFPFSPFCLSIRLRHQKCFFIRKMHTILRFYSLASVDIYCVRSRCRWMSACTKKFIYSRLDVSFFFSFFLYFVYHSFGFFVSSIRLSIYLRLPLDLCSWMFIIFGTQIFAMLNVM